MNYHWSAAYNINITQTPTAGGDCFLFIHNNATSPGDFLVKKVMISAAANETVEITNTWYLGGVVVGGTDYVPVPLLGGHTTPPPPLDCVCQRGVAITQIAPGNIVDLLKIPVGFGMTQFDYGLNIVIPKYYVLAFRAITGGIALNMSLTIMQRTH